MMHLKRILVPVDFSKESELAVDWAVRLCRNEKEATIFLFHSLTPLPVVPDAGFDVRMMDDVWRSEKKQLSDWKKKIPSIITALTVCTNADLVQGVIEECRREKIDLVVMTTHGRQGLKRLAHPNATEKVVRLAPCPVLALHLNKEDRVTERSRQLLKL